MKTKFLLGILTGAAVLAACNSEEEFNAPVEQTSPVVFEVSLDADATTRLNWRPDGKNNVAFQKGDLMSLYHGISTTAAEGESVTLTGYENAIYEAKEGSADDALAFYTAAMIKEGYAIMVWPADTTFANDGTAAPVIEIEANQTAETKLKMPYISEVLTIDEYTGNVKGHEAGYNRTYPVVLKQLGSVLTLNTKPVNDGVISDLVQSNGIEALKVDRVELTAKNSNGEGLFNTKVALKVGDGTPYAKTNYEHWTGITEVDFTASLDEATAGVLATTDATNTTAVFTLLPTSTETDDVATEGEHAASVKITTNYGAVTIKTSDSERTWAKTEGNLDVAAQQMSVAEGIGEVLKNTYKANSTPSATFGNENLGRWFTRWVKADMWKLDINNLHIKNAKHLIDVLKVMDAMKEISGSTVATAGTINLFLDGDTDGVFTMTPEAAEAYASHVNATGPAVTFTACDVAGEECNVIKFTNTTETEVPTVLKFATNEVAVALDGTWKWSKENKTVSSEVKSITVLENSTLNVSNTVKAAYTGTKSADNVIVNIEGNVNVSGTTYIENLTVRNLSGTIKIPTNAELLVKSILRNQAPSLTTYGSIYNSGVLACVESTGGKIQNFGGYIKQMTATSKTYISANEFSNSTFSNAHLWNESGSSYNLIGTLVLYDKNDENYSVNNTDNKGFIVVEMDQATVTSEDLGTEANYVVLKGDCTSFDFTNVSDGRLLYVEVDADNELVWSSSDATAAGLNGVIVRKGSKLTIKKGNTVKTKAAFIKGNVYVGGEFNVASYTTYYGGSAADKENVRTY